MNTTRIKLSVRTLGAAAIGAAIAVNLGGSHIVRDLAGGSGDSATSTYSSPVVPAMSVNPTAMSLGATVTAKPPAATMAVSDATPSVKASPAPECVNNGQCP